jgi:hypothetical protein
LGGGAGGTAIVVVVVAGALGSVGLPAHATRFNDKSVMISVRMSFNLGNKAAPLRPGESEYRAKRLGPVGAEFH